jgi:hypothetical protein
MMRAGKFGCVMIAAGVVFGAGQPASGSPWESTSDIHVEIEAGPVWQSRNDVQIPNDASGTRFSLVDLAGTGPWPAARLYLTWNINTRHSLRALLAPLSYSETGTCTTAIDFAGTTFAASTPVQATYQFNSWRVSYRYRVYDGSRWRWWIGFTAKIRDAKIELERAGASAQKTDVGFVPLLHLGAWVRLAGPWTLVFDLDALAGGPGRAEDIAVKLAYGLSDRWRVAAGYRTVEGGADVSEVYNFAWFHYAVLSATYSF